MSAGEEVKFVLEGETTGSIEDSGMAYILELDDDRHERLFVRIQSWDDDERMHPEIQMLLGHRLRVTIEVID